MEGLLKHAMPAGIRPARKRDAPWSLKARTAVPRDAGVVAGHRFYSPGIGRWASRDPVGERGGYGLYSFGSGQPSGRFDVLGLFSYASTLTNNLGLVTFRAARQPIHAYCKATGRHELVGNAVLLSAYVDATRHDVFPDAILNTIIDAVDGPIAPFDLARVRQASYLGAGFTMAFEPNPRLNECCRCTTTAWRQMKDTGLDYLWSPARTASDFPGNTFSGYFPRSVHRGFSLDFLCDGTTRFRAVWGYSIEIFRFGPRAGDTDVSLWIAF